MVDAHSTRSSSPFSLVEFGNLVALALETDLTADQFSESFLQFDPEFTTKENPTPLLKKPSRFRFNKTPNMKAADSTSGWTDASPSRPRLMLDRLKHKASAFVLRTGTEVGDKPRSQAPQTRPTDPRSSFFEDDNDAFTPYIPIATQLERAVKHQVGIFSRPASLVTAPPPSPTKSIRSFSTTSSAAPVTPTADVDFFAPRPSASSPDAGFRSRSRSRWSTCTDSSSSYTSSFSYPNHPFASHDDPFAKGSVQVVRHSSHSQEGYWLGGYTTHLSPNPKRRSRTQAPVPAPACPLPTPPPSAQKKKQKVLRIRVLPATATSPARQDWTLSLPTNVDPPRSPVSPSPAQPQLHRARTRSFLSQNSGSGSGSDTHSLQCPSAWHPSPPPSPTCRSTAAAASASSESLSSLSSTSSTSPARLSSFPLPPSGPFPSLRSSTHSSRRAPRTADSTASNESTATITPTAVQIERERALAVLNGTYTPSHPSSSTPPSPSALTTFHRRVAAAHHLPSPSPSPSHHKQKAKDADEMSLASADSGTYYTARSSLCSARAPRASFGSAFGCSVPVVWARVRADSGVRGAGC